MENGISQRQNNQLLIQHISDAAILTDAAFTITAFNAAAENLFGYKEHEVAGKNIALLIPFNTNHPNLLSVKSTEFTQGIVEQVTRDSRRIYLHASLHPITPVDAPISFLILYQPVEDNRRNIAARHNAPDTSLQKSEEKYRLLIEQALDGIYIINHNGWFLYVNARGCEMSGYTMEELLQLNFIDVIPPEQRAHELNNFYSLRNGPLLYYDGQLMRKDGSIMYIELCAQYTSDGQIMAIAHDITQRKIAETALQQSEEKYRRLIEQASDGILVYTREYIVLEANTAACNMTGYTHDELIGMYVLNIVDPDDLKRAPLKTAALNAGGIVTSERKMRKKDGTAFYGESAVQLMPDGRVVCFVRDVTQRKQTELALQHREERHRMLFLNSPLPIFVMDLENFHFLDVNDAAINTYGYTKEEFLNMTALDIRPSEDYDKFHNKARVIKQGLVDMGVFKHVKKDGSIIDVEIYTHNFLYDERNSRLVLALDVTEKLKAQRELLNTTNQLRKLSDHLQNIREIERTRISREIHDELGQQLTILKMDISWLHQKLKYYKNPDLLRRTEDTVKMLNDTIKTVRRIATELRPSLLDDLGLVAAIEWQSKEFENRSGIKITFTSSVNNLVIENAVATSLFRIYQEALTNVARHAYAHNVFSNLVVNNRELTLTIKDDGQGFDMATIDNKKTLGLLGMRERTLMMGGNFTLQSTIGNGTTITVQTTL